MDANPSVNTLTIFFVLLCLYLFIGIKHLILRTFINIRWKHRITLKKNSSAFSKISGIYLLKCNSIKNNNVFKTLFIVLKIEFVLLIIYTFLQFVITDDIRVYILKQLSLVGLINLFIICIYFIITQQYKK